MTETKVKTTIKDEVRSHYCEIAHKAAIHLGFPKIAADCFCSDNKSVGTFDHSRGVVEFVKEAVDKRIRDEQEQHMAELGALCQSVIDWSESPGDATENSMAFVLVEYARQTLNNLKGE